MIHSTSNLHGYNRTDAAAAISTAKQASTPKADAEIGERLSSSSTQALREALNNSPEIRPEVVEKGKALAVDPNYPPRQLIESLAKLMVDSRDSSDSE
ncbi:MAG: hypothetical protein QM760_08285 [Nibricoccus sp.]